MASDGVDVMKRFALRSGYEYHDDEAAAYKSTSGTCINIGAGAFAHSRWTNLDVSSDHYRGIQPADFVEYDLTKLEPIPFANRSVSLAYCSHTVEHIKDAHAKNLFSEVFRVLETGGVFRLTCPNADSFYNAALRNDFSAFNFRTKHWFTKNGISMNNVRNADFLVRAFASQVNPTLDPMEISNPALLANIENNFDTLEKEEFLDWLTGKVDFSINHIGSHVNWWNYNKFQRFLSDAGFKIIMPSTFGGSIAAPLRNTQKFDKTVPEESIYVEAIKM